MCCSESCCANPSALIYGYVPNKTTDYVLTCWIIYIYISYAICAICYNRRLDSRG